MHKNGANVNQGCWLCACKKSDEFIRSTIVTTVKPSDFKITDSHYGCTFRLVRCRNCGFVYANPLPCANFVEMYTQLEDAEYVHSSSARLRSFAEILESMKNIHPNSRSLLDIGAGVGLLCKLALDIGLDVEGVEPSTWAVKEARKQYGIDLKNQVFPHPDLKENRFDLITLIDVIEHVSNPLSLLKSISESLNPSGLAVIVTPNIESLAARLIGRRWWHYRTAHICFFSPKSMLFALSKVKLELIAIRSYRWWLPLGYVSGRLQNYLPVKSLNRILLSNRLGKRLFNINIPINLHDSKMYFVSPKLQRGK